MADDKAQIIDELARVKNVGDVRARQLYEQLEVRSIEQLVELARRGDLQQVSGIGSTTEERILGAAEGLLESKPKDAQLGESSGQEAQAEAEPEQDEQDEQGSPEAAEAPAASEEGEEAEDDHDEAQEEEEERPTPGVQASEAQAPPLEEERAPISGLERFLSSLVCPNCGNEDFDTHGATLTCTACRREYNFQDGLADLSPPYRRVNSLPQRIMETRFYSRFYEDVMRPRLTSVVTERTLREEYALASELLELEPGSRVLDVACGTGNFTRYFAQRLDAMNQGQASPEYVLVGMDVSWPMLETARKYLRRDELDEQVFLVRGDATRLPLGRESFDRLHCAGALHLMEDIDEALRNFACVLERGGVCVIGTFVLGEGRLRRLTKRLLELPSKFHWFSREELRQRLARAGFEVIEENVEGDAIAVKARKV